MVAELGFAQAPDSPHPLSTAHIAQGSEGLTPSGSHAESGDRVSLFSVFLEAFLEGCKSPLIEPEERLRG